MVKEEELKEEVGYDYYDFKVSSDKNCKFCGWMTGVAMLMMSQCSKNGKIVQQMCVWVPSLRKKYIF